MAMLEDVKPKTKAVAATAAGGFFVANPLISAFLIGAGLAIYFTYRKHLYN